MNRFLATAILLLLAVEASGQTLAVVGGRVHTVGPTGTLEQATILVVDGRIEQIGRRVDIPDGAEIIDATGKIVTPGLFAPMGQLGLREVSGGAGPVDARQRGDVFTASFDVADAYDRRSTLIAINRIEGITRSAIVPAPGGADDHGEHGHILSGLAAVVHLGDNDGVQKRAAAMVVTLGESGSRFAGGTRTGAWLRLKNALDEAREYRDYKLDYERGMRRSYEHSRNDLEALQGVIDGSVPLLVNVHRASDIETLIGVVGEYRVRAIVNGGAEAWMVADELADAGIPVILSAVNNLPRSFDSLNARRGAANILTAAGVKVALTDSSAQTHNARNIRQSAGNAAGDGLAWEEALRSITLTPAEIYGVADNVGSIEVGKYADLVIWPGDPLELMNYPEQVVIAGQVVPMVSRQTLLRDRYLQSTPGVPPAYRD